MRKILFLSASISSLPLFSASIGDLLGIDQSGSIFVNGSIDREMIESPLTVTVEAINSRAAVSLFNTLQVSIEILDVNDNAPMFEIDPTLVYSIPEVS